MTDTPQGGGAALREIAVVLAVALTGLFLVVLAAFVPWYEREIGASVIDLRPPNRLAQQR